MSIIDTVDHRPWPLPRGPWVMFQRWTDLLFIHRPVDPNALRALVPRPLALDTFDGQAWVATAPFRVSRLRARLLPPFPGVSSFPELNVRTYVHLDGKQGVYFFSLDAGSRFAVAAARFAYALPYLRASMRIRRHAGRVIYTSARTDRRAPPARFAGEYGPSGDVARAVPGSLAHWLTERYCLYAVRGGRVYEGDIHHVQWPLQPATASIETDTMAASQGIRPLTTAPLLHFARRLDVLVWPPRRVR